MASRAQDGHVYEAQMGAHQDREEAGLIRPDDKSVAAKTEKSGTAQSGGTMSLAATPQISTSHRVTGIQWHDFGRLGVGREISQASQGRLLPQRWIYDEA